MRLGGRGRLQALAGGKPGLGAAIRDLIDVCENRNWVSEPDMARDLPNATTWPNGETEIALDDPATGAEATVVVRVDFAAGNMTVVRVA